MKNDIEEMNLNQLKDTHDKMLLDYYSSKDFYDLGTENMLVKLQDEINKRQLVNDEKSQYQIMGE